MVLLLRTMTVTTINRSWPCGSRRHKVTRVSRILFGARNAWLTPTASAPDETTRDGKAVKPNQEKGEVACRKTHRG